VRAIEAEKLAAAEKAAADREVQEEKVAVLSPTDGKPDAPPALDLPRALQSELRRVGCATGAVDGNWNTASQRALELFNKHAGMKLEAKTASADALEAVKMKTSRVCPLICEHGFRAEGERCARISCRAGYHVNDDNECEKIPAKKPVATREEIKPKRDAGRKQVESKRARPQASGQYICGNGGCRQIGKNCRIVEIQSQPQGGFRAQPTEVCN